jgi:O-antigen/teichoic acid export membrane protein
MIGEVAVAEFRIAAEGAQLVAFAYVIGNSLLLTEYGRLFFSGNLHLLERAARKSALIILIASIPIFIVFLLFAKQIVTTVFGDAYLGSALPLQVLSIGHLIALIFGDPLSILNMSGNQKATLRITIYALIINVLLNTILIPEFGIVGAAAATSFSFVLLRLSGFYYVWLRLGIKCDAISVLLVAKKGYS